MRAKNEMADVASWRWMMETMTSKQRVLTALEHKEPDRVPVDLGGYQTGIMASAYEEVKELLGIKEKTRILELKQQLAVPDEEALNRFHVDTRYIFPRSALVSEPQKTPDGSLMAVTEWCNQKVIKTPTTLYFEYYDAPLDRATVENIDDFDWPDPDLPQRYAGLKEDIEALARNNDFAIVTTLGGGVLEKSWELRGMERFFTDIIDEPEFIEKLFDKILEIEKKLYGNFLSITGEYLDVVQIFDDFGAQHGPLYPPRFFREVIKPREAELIATVKSKTDAKIMFHSCGAVHEFIPDLIEIGVDVLNPIQVSAKDMDTARLKKEFGKDICFWGAIDTQGVLPFGTVQDVREEVKKRIYDLAPGGGYILSSVHNIQAKVPAGNIVAMYDSAREYGSYM